MRHLANRRASPVVSILALLTVVVLAGQSAHAQDHPKIEVAGTYAVIPTLFAPACHGASGSVAFNLNSWFGVVGEIAGCTAESSRASLFSTGGSRDWLTYLAGPRVAGRGRLAPHAQFLVGGAHFTREDSFDSRSSNGFGMTIGIGCDLKITDRVGIRLVQLEYLRGDFDPLISHNVRIQTGVVVVLKK